MNFETVSGLRVIIGALNLHLRKFTQRKIFAHIRHCNLDETLATVYTSIVSRLDPPRIC